MRSYEDCETGTFWCGWNVSRSNAARRILSDECVRREWKNEPPRPRSSRPTVATVRIGVGGGCTIVSKGGVFAGDGETEHECLQPLEFIRLEHIVRHTL